MQKIGTLTVPETETKETDEVTPTATDKTTHKVIQYLLLKLWLRSRLRHMGLLFFSEVEDIFDLKKQMDELGITKNNLIEMLEIEEEELDKIITSNDEATQLQLWENYVKVKLDDELIEKLILFFNNLFPDKNTTACYIKRIICSPSNITARRMLNSIERLISLSDDITNIRSDKDCLQVFFIIVCIETIYKLSDDMGVDFITDRERIVDFFCNHIEEPDKEFISKHFKTSRADNTYEPGSKFNRSVNMETFAWAMYEIRCDFVHEGILWGFSFGTKDTPVINNITVGSKKCKTEMIFDVSLNYEVFRNICVKGLLNCLDNYCKMSE